MTTPLGPSSIATNLARVRERVEVACERSARDPESVTLIAVTKTWPAETLLEAVAAGATHLGENRVQEALAKASAVEAGARAAGDGLAAAIHIGHPGTDLAGQLAEIGGRMADAVDDAT
ncbi:MAG TPA: hypothetical protein PKD27_14610, partial [Tepidiformaceae bacterium]|nr:hypothetical protein [Tepidiformaceae bacterium]